MGTLILPISSLIGIFILNIVVGLFLGFGTKHYWFFEMLHFLGGFFMAMFLAGLSGSALFILLGLAIISIVWESVEYAVAKMPRPSGYLKRIFHLKSVKPKWKDTILDIALNFAGAALFLLLFPAV